MPSPKKEAIERNVIEHIAILGGLDPKTIKKSELFKEDLGWGENLRAALAPGFEKIARVHNVDAKISMKNCKELKKVKDAVNLVWKAVGGT